MCTYSKSVLNENSCVELEDATKMRPNDSFSRFFHIVSIFLYN